MQRLKHTIDQLGWLNGCIYLMARLLSMVSGTRIALHKYYFVAQPVPQNRWLAPRRGASVEVRQISQTDPITKEFPRSEAVLIYRFSQGAICLTALKADKFIGYLWFTLGAYDEDEVRCRYIPLPVGKSAWDFDVYLHPEHRNGIAFLKLWDEANSFLLSKGIRWSLSRISAFNSNSMQSHGRMGAHRMGSATFVSIGSFQLSMATVSPYLFFSMHPKSVPTFALNPERNLISESVS